MKFLTLTVLLSLLSVFANAKTLKIKPIEISAAKAEQFTDFFSPRAYDLGNWDFYIEADIDIDINFIGVDGESSVNKRTIERGSNLISVPKGTFKTDFTEKEHLLLNLDQITADIQAEHKDITVTSVTITGVSVWIYESMAPQAFGMVWGHDMAALYQNSSQEKVLKIEEHGSTLGEFFKVSVQLID